MAEQFLSMGQPLSLTHSIVVLKKGKWPLGNNNFMATWDQEGIFLWSLYMQGFTFSVSICGTQTKGLQNERIQEARSSSMDFRAGKHVSHSDNIYSVTTF